MQYIILAGFAILIKIAIVLISGVLSLSDPTGPFASLFSVYAYLIQYPDSQISTIPAALASDSALQSALRAGFFSTQTLIVLLVVAVLFALALLASAYAKALSLGVLQEAATGFRVDFLSVVRAARKFWWPSVRALTPYAAFFFLLTVLAAPMTILQMAYPFMHGSLNAPLQPVEILFLGILLVVGLFRTVTLAVDGLIVQGSKRPLKDALRFFVQNTKTQLLDALAFSSIGIVMLTLYIGISAMGASGLLALFLSVFVLALLAIWRLFVSGYVVARVHEKSQALRGSPLSSK